MDRTAPCVLDLNTFSGWYTPPSVRGISDIIWSCLSTILLCAWASLHINIRAHGETSLNTALRNLKWVFLGIFTPELVAFTAIAQYIKAWYSVVEMEKMDHPWTMTQGFFTIMGGFFVTVPGEGSQRDTRYPLLGRTRTYTLHYYDLAQWVKQGHIRLPALTDQSIKAMARPRPIVEFIASLQTARFLFNYYTRVSEGLAISKLEVITLAYVFCYITSYLLWWDKPVNIAAAIDLGVIHQPVFIIESRAKNLVHQSTCEAIGSGLFVGLFFGGIHLLVWNDSFPTLLEQHLWRVTAVVVTVMIPLSTLCVWNLLCRSPIGDVCLAVWFLPYLACRGFLVFEAFSAFRAAPGDVYKGAEWLGYLPHF